jgi:hypothetical protein
VDASTTERGRDFIDQRAASHVDLVPLLAGWLAGM